MGNKEYDFVLGFIILLYIGCRVRLVHIDEARVIADLTSIENEDLQKGLLIHGKDRSYRILFWLHSVQNNFNQLILNIKIDTLIGIK